MDKISVVVVTENEEKNIGDCLATVEWADEIVIVDAFSIDKTVEIAGEYTDKIFKKSWEGYASQKNFGIEKTSSEWILSLDADERVTPELQDEIQKVLQSSSVYNGYYIPFKNYLGKKWMRGAGLYPDFHLRLFRKGKGRFTKEIHEFVELEGKIGYLKKPIVHYTYRDLADYLKKINHYTTLEAQEMLEAGRKLRRMDFLKPPVVFLNLFFLKQGCRDGLLGVVNAVFLSFYNFLKYAKLMEKTRKS